MGLKVGDVREVVMVGKWGVGCQSVYLREGFSKA
jgi:hypothetical protein